MEHKKRKHRIKPIKARIIEPETIEVFGPKGDSFGKLNELEVLDLRCQIKRNKAKGYYVYHNAEKVFIGSDGNFSKYIPIFEQGIKERNYLLGIDHNLYIKDTND